MGEGTFIDDGDAGSWADALRMPPWIEDRDGCCFYNISFLCPDPALQRLSNAGEGSTDAAPFANVPTFHANPDSPEVQQDHA